MNDSEKKFEMLFNSMNDAIFITSSDGHFMEVNDAACDMYGYSRKEFLKMTPSDINPEEYAGSLPERIRSIFRKGHTFSESMHKRKNGEKFHVEISGKIVEYEGQKAILAIVRDTTYCKRPEADLENIFGFPSENPNPILRVGWEGQVIYANVPGKRFLDALKNGSDNYLSGRLGEAVARSVESGTNEILEMETEDGSHFAFTVVPFAEGGYSNLYGRDVTDLRKAEEALREAYQFIDQVISSAREGIIVYDRDLRYVVWNEYMRSITGMSEEDVIGYFAFDPFPHLGARGIDRFLKKALAGEVVKSPDMEYYIEKTGKSGWVSGTYAPQYDTQGKIIGVIGILVDITEHKKSEEALLESEDKFRTLFDSMNEGAFLNEMVYNDSGVAVDYRIININHAFENLTGLNKKNAVGKLMSQLCSAGPPHLDIFSQVVATGSPIRFETYFAPARKFFRISAFSPKKETFAIIFDDISKKIEVEENLRENKARLRALSQNVIAMHEEERARLSRELHDQIGKELTGLHLEIEWMSMRKKTQLKDFDKLTFMVENATAEVRRICRGLRPFILDDMGLMAAIKSISSEFNGINNLEVRTHLSYIEKGEISPDATICLFRVFQEALNNTVKHSGADKVIISLKKKKNVVLVISDDGEGFSPEEQERENKKGLGRGLGLIGMKERATLCGGTLEIESAKGKGTTIRMTVPLE